MSRRKFYKEITCTRCEGTGLDKNFYDNDHFFYAQEDNEDAKCIDCDGKGYVTCDTENESTGEILTVMQES